MFIYNLINFAKKLSKPELAYFMLGVICSFYSLIEIFIVFSLIYTFYLITKYLIERRRKKC